MTDTQAMLKRAATTMTIRVTLQRADVTRLREISIAERRDPRDQAALLLERAIREYDAGSFEMQQAQIEALQAEVRASNKILNELSPDYGEP